jgi:hypothetical protein
MAETKPLGCIGNADRKAPWCPGHLKQELMLLGMQIDSMRHPLAELQEASQLESKVREGLEQVSLGWIPVDLCHHKVYRLTIYCGIQAVRAALAEMGAFRVVGGAETSPRRKSSGFKTFMQLQVLRGQSRFGYWREE